MPAQTERTNEITLTVTEDELRILLEALGTFEYWHFEVGIVDHRDDLPFFQSVKAKVLTARYEVSP